MRVILVCVSAVAILFSATVGNCQTPSPSEKATNFRLRTSEDGILITENDQPVLNYQSKWKSKNGTHRRANYVHPLYDLAGNILTEDFPDDHLHHRGIFWAWHQLKVGDKLIGDGWMCENLDWKVNSANPEFTKSGFVRITSEVQWQSPLFRDENKRPIPIVNETTMIDVYPAEDESRDIDFEIQLLAALPNVAIGGSDNDKGYGGFSARLIQPEDIAFNTSQGFVEAKKLQMECGKWVDIVGTFGRYESKSGVAIFVHPSSAGFPQKWILRSKAKSMQNPVYPGRTPVVISQTEPTILRYRLVLHRNEMKTKELDSSYREYSSIKFSSD